MQFWETGLNPEQKRAVETVEGPVLILAGAGSGKTKTLTHRIVYLLAGKQVAPESILAVTFTNKAAQEMRERVSHMLERVAEAEGVHYRMPQFIGTFHNISARILRRDIERLGYGKDFNIIDADEQLSLVKRSMKELEINPDQVKPRSILEAISNAKSREVSAARLVSLAESYFEELVGKVYERYQAGLIAANALDFDDLILLTVRLLSEYSDVLERYQETFRYIMVDEYQDTNPLQYQLIKLLAETNRTPFDIAEAESELTSGFHTEYSGMKWAMFFMAEYAYLFIASAVGTVLFLGGGNAPWPALQFIPSFVWFFLKSFFFVFLFIWIRWSYPRLRVDRLMEFCWKFLLPWSLVNVALAGFFFLLRS
jgi:superfamily I DNA/RNA helicase